MAGKTADGSMFCQADGLSQSMADRASVPLADGQNTTKNHLLTVGKTRPMMHEKATLPTNVGLERILLQNYVKSGCRETLQEDKRSVK